MKKQILVIFALFVGITMSAQKNELKAIEKALKGKDYTSALATIKTAESLISNADVKSKAKFYFLKGKALYGSGALLDAGKAFSKLLAIEKNGKPKYTNEAGKMLNDMIQKFATDASKNYNAKNYAQAAKEFYQVFVLSPRDTSYVDNAALSAFFAKDYKTSLNHYKELASLGYTGIQEIFEAKDKATGAIVKFDSEKAMKLQQKLGIVVDGKKSISKSRVTNTAKMIAKNYINLGDNDKALEAIQSARKLAPKDYDLLIDEANVYYHKGNNVKFKEKLAEAIKLNPNDASLFYNMGVMSMEANNDKEALRNFQKAIELDTKNVAAYNNLGAVILKKAQAIVDQMNDSSISMATYDRLEKQQLEVYKEALPYYEKAYSLDAKNFSVVKTLLGLYSNLEMTTKEKELKAVYDAIK